MVQLIPSSGQGQTSLKSCFFAATEGIEACAILNPFFLTPDLSGAILARGREESRTPGAAKVDPIESYGPS